MKEQQLCGFVTIVFNVAEFILVLTATIVFQAMYGSDKKEDMVMNWSDEGPD